MSRRMLSLFLLAVALAVVALLVLWLAPGPLAAWRHWQAPPPQAPKLDAVQAALLHRNPAAGAAYPVVLERPLLSPSRRVPAPAKVASAPDAPEEPPPLAIELVKLRGLVAGPTLVGVLLEEEGGEPRFVRRGEKVGDWTLAGIEGRMTVFKRADEVKKIELPVAQDTDDARPGSRGQPAARAANSRTQRAPPDRPPRRAVPARGGAHPASLPGQNGQP